MRKAMPLKTFLGQISGVGEPGFEEEFNSYNLGITWKSMMNWGEVRANADGKTEEIGEALGTHDRELETHSRTFRQTRIESGRDAG